MPFFSPGAVPSIVGGVNIGPIVHCLTISRASAFSSGVKSMRSSSVRPWRSNGAGRVGKGCVGEVHSPGTVDAGTGRSSIGHTGSPVTRSKTNANACLVTWITALMRRPFTVRSASTGAVGLS